MLSVQIRSVRGAGIHSGGASRGDWPVSVDDSYNTDTHRRKRQRETITIVYFSLVKWKDSSKTMISKDLPSGREPLMMMMMMIYIY